MIKVKHKTIYDNHLNLSINKFKFSRCCAIGFPPTSANYTNYEIDKDGNVIVEKYIRKPKNIIKNDLIVLKGRVDDFSIIKEMVKTLLKILSDDETTDDTIDYDGSAWIDVVETNLLTIHKVNEGVFSPKYGDVSSLLKTIEEHIVGIH